MDFPCLINEIKEGSVIAQQCFFNQLSARMFVLCKRYVKNTEDAEERMLDGFHKFFKTIGSFKYEGDAALYGWLKKIMINECIMQLRKNNVLTIVSEAEAIDIPWMETALDNLSTNELLNLILQLPVGFRTVFNLYAIEGYDHNEIAEKLGISKGTSKSQLARARNLLQKMLLQKENYYAKQQSK